MAHHSIPVRGGLRLWRFRQLLGLALALAIAPTSALVAQSSLRMWGSGNYDTAAWELPTIGVWAAGIETMILRADGRLFVQGAAWPVPHPPAGTVFVATHTSGGGQWGIGLCADGSALTWGNIVYTPPVPALPPGTTYTHVAAGFRVATFARSDGAVVATTRWYNSLYGELTPPQPPPGVAVTKLVSFQYQHLALLTNGTIMAWGDNQLGQCNVPALPPGVIYTDVVTGFEFSLALRSDGQVVGFGNNALGQLNIPPLPPGTTYRNIAAGTRYSLFLRSDGVFLHTGPSMVWSHPTIPPGLQCTQLGAGTAHNVALLSDGTVLMWHEASQSGLPETLRIPVPTNTADRFVGAAIGGGLLALRADGTAESYGAGTFGGVPPLPVGLRYTKVTAGYAHTAFLRSDGQLLFTGDNSVGQQNAPPLAPGTTWIDVEAYWADTIALRSDGQAFAFGNNTNLVPTNLYTIPALPPGLRYTQVDVAYLGMALLRSDGQIVVQGLGSGGFNPGMRPAPPLPPGLVYTEVATGNFASIALRSDGTAVYWPFHSPNSNWRDVPQLPFGVHYVEIDMSDASYFALRRSDGWIERCGASTGVTPDWFTPALDPGTSYVEICGHVGQMVLTRVGPTSTYTSFAPGCSGSLPSTRLVPRDTPRIGKALKVTLFDLPQDAAFMVLGWNRIGPVSLAQFGMPGCSQHVSADAALLLLGQNHQAAWELPIPNSVGFVGFHFFNQAVVLDPGANAVGAVVSDAAEAVVGHW